MTTDTYKEALKQAKADLADRVATLGAAQDTAERAEKDIVELRQTIAALQRLCGEPEFVEEDALGLTDAIRLAFKTEDSKRMGGMSAQDVREKMESMGYRGRWGNLLASIHTVIKRLFDKGELEAAGNLNGRETFRWKEKRTLGGKMTLDPAPPTLIANPKQDSMREAMARKPGQPPIPPASMRRDYRIKPIEKKD